MSHSHPMPADPEVVEFIERTLSWYPADAYAMSLEENRRLYDAMAEAFRAPRPEGIETEDFAVAAADPAREIPCRRYLPRGVDRAAPLVLYAHGGGFVLGGLESHDDACAGIAKRTGLEVVAVDYRLAPENLHPAQGDDFEAAFEHVAKDGRKVIVAGDSAGGNLVGALVLRRRAADGPAPIGQVLIYPGLGGDRSRGSYVEMADAPLLKAKEGETYAGIRTGGTLTEAQRNDPDMAPLKAQDLSDLPPAFVVTAHIDPIRDDGEAWARRLSAAGVPAEWRDEPELVHGYLRARHMSKRTAESFAAICDAIVRMAEGRFVSAPEAAGA
ncbi:alpha/beta hydrolase [Albimonas sp. CAU 1670]|uniref:alpha/beta hydrolase n=1 Tax=Albimonas sp. CAU 1670 TaxID=3032599 RepID=UPI0023DCDA9E|nr:alpha/beta hydrolase [Albimonas sp. CAU 1670]MDF2234772.1 alpha/beta hydrolase [Albimonas sp. CAU 1670]